MKKILRIFVLLIVVFGLSGCSFQKNTNIRTAQLDKESQTESERIEQGIEYMFNLYHGDFIAIVDRNHSSDSHVEKNCLSCFLIIYIQILMRAG